MTLKLNTYIKKCEFENNMAFSKYTYILILKTEFEQICNWKKWRCSCWSKSLCISMHHSFRYLKFCGHKFPNRVRWNFFNTSITYPKRQTKEINNTRKTHLKTKSHAHNLIPNKLGLPYYSEFVITARVVLFLKIQNKSFSECANKTMLYQRGIGIMVS